VNILILGAGGGGGNILRSLKTLFRSDLAVAQKSDAKYAERLRRAVTTRFLDTNEFSLSDLPPEERLLIGSPTSRRFGSRHDPQVARVALEESRAEVERLISRFAVVIVIASGGKGTGAGTVFPLADIARRQRKLVIPIFVRPSFQRHEVEKQRYDHALHVTKQFDAAQIRLIEILNDRGYVETDPQPQAVVWERMNRPIARGLRGLLYVLSDLSQVDPSDLSALFAGEGRLRMGFAEIDPALDRDPTDDQIELAARTCWDDSFYAFQGQVGTSLVCIQGDWSNIADARIKSRLATLAVAGHAEHPYNPLYARASRTPKPWGVTAIFAEYTGQGAPLDLDWTTPSRATRGFRDITMDIGADVTPNVTPEVIAADAATEVVAADTSERVDDSPARADQPSTVEPRLAFSTLWEFAVALNRQDPAALAIAQNGVEPRIAVDGFDVRKLLTTVWFRSAFDGLSEAWRERLLDALIAGLVIPNHALKSRRGLAPLESLGYAEIKEIYSKTFVPEAARGDVELLLAAGRLWGAQVLGRFRFAGSPRSDGGSRLGALLQTFRS
jgi:cell division GTPase FtsZ